MALLGRIPFEFTADSSKIGGAGRRPIVAMADRRFSFRQMILETAEKYGVSTELQCKPAGTVAEAPGHLA